MRAPAPSPQADHLLSERRIWIMGVLNATPDSFYAGTRVSGAVDASVRAERMIAEGADVIDVGGESTRPGSLPVSESEELSRILPVLEELHARWPQQLLSIDTQKAFVARRALNAGASLINDVSAFQADPDMAEVAAQAQCPVVLMHMQGVPETMQKAPHYRNVVDEVKAFLVERMSAAVRAGVHETNIILDPGIGFGKTSEHNLLLLRQLKQLAALGRPLLVGVSRKSFLGALGGVGLAGKQALPAEDRLEGSLAAGLWAVGNGARALRVHDVGATRRALDVWSALN